MFEVGFGVTLNPKPVSDRAEGDLADPLSDPETSMGDGLSKVHLQKP